MQTLEEIKRRIDNTEDLHSIVRTMKTLAAVSIRQYEKAVEALAEYNRTTELGLHVVLSQQAGGAALPQRPLRKGVGVIVFGSDQGMAGPFNEQIANYAVAQLDEMQIEPEHRSVSAVGMRAVVRLEDAGQTVSEIFTVPGSAAGITRLVQEVLLRSEQWRERHAIDRIFLFYHRLTSSAAYRPHTVQLWPISLERLRPLEEQRWPTKVLPTFTMEWSPLFSALLRQHVFVTLYRAFAESLASENASRLVSMQIAERNIEERLDNLTAEYHQLRQTAITSELLDIVSGSEVASSAA